MDLTEDFYAGFLQDTNAGNIASVANHECGAVTELVSDHLGIHDFVTTISTACSSSANSIMMAAQMIGKGMLDIAIAGGADSLSKFTLNGFNTLMILDKQPCQPFDQNRRGLNLGEGAAYVLLMSEKAMQQCGATAICRVSGYANTNDAYHQTASSPEGTGNKMAMLQALKVAGLQPADIDYINLHGTGTANNDSSEGLAVTVVFGDKVPMASSTKGFTGHTLGASGAVEAVFSALSIRDGIVFPNIRWQTQMEDVPWKPITELRKGCDIKHVLSNSFGFGGNCSSLIFSKS
jgi:3-oxoacyl-[acyl-carrier-protein] synthase-1